MAGVIFTTVGEYGFSLASFVFWASGETFVPDEGITGRSALVGLGAFFAFLLENYPCPSVIRLIRASR